MIKKIFISLLLLSVIWFWWIFYTYNNLLEYSWNVEQKISLNIPLWTPIKKVAELLQEKWILEYKWAFYVHMKINKLEWKIQAWDFIFDTPIWLNDLFSQLWNAQQKEARIIIPEGSTVDDIDRILTKKSLIEKWEFIECAKSCEFPNYNFFFDWNIEWYLFPDTYFVPTDTFTSESFANRMFDNFLRRVLTDDFKNKYKEQWKTLEEIVIMASMIERESRYAEEMKVISWILRKRIDIKMALWVDATTRYYKKSKTWVLTVQDFKNDNPYNTRIHLWLPPTAISNPWINALTASLNPEKSDYYFYLHWNDWQIHYWKTNEDHNFNKFKYLK